MKILNRTAKVGEFLHSVRGVVEILAVEKDCNYAPLLCRYTVRNVNSGVITLNYPAYQLFDGYEEGEDDAAV